MHWHVCHTCFFHHWARLRRDFEEEEFIVFGFVVMELTRGVLVVVYVRMNVLNIVKVEDEISAWFGADRGWR